MTSQSLLIIHQGALGDLVLTFPAIREVRKRFGRTDGLCQGALGRLACHLRIFDRHFPLESAIFSSLYADHTAPGTKAILEQYDRIVLFSWSEKLENSVRKGTDATVVRIPPRPSHSQRVHVARYILRQLAAYGLLKKDDTGEAIPKKSHEHRIRRSDPPEILLHPGSGSRRKNWPLENFIRVHERLKGDGMTPAFVLGPAEEFLFDELRRTSPSPRVYQPADLIELAELLRQADGFIGNDSGVSHLAAFLNIPTVAIFGPSDPVRWHPAGPSVAVLRAEGLACEPCFETEKENCDGEICLKRISSEAVADGFHRLFPVK